jgi:hypothetical protein
MVRRAGTLSRTRHGQSRRPLKEALESMAKVMVVDDASSELKLMESIFRFAPGSTSPNLGTRRSSCASSCR